MFKGFWIDNVFCGGVLKFGDMFWRKDGLSEVFVEVDFIDEFESEVLRG